MFLKVTLQDNGDLVFEAGEDLLAEKEEYLDRKPDFAFTEIMDNVGMIGNGWDILHPADVGTLMDEGTIIITSDFELFGDGEYDPYTIWYDPHHAIRNPVKELINEGKLVLKNGMEDGDLEKHLKECPYCRSLKDSREFNLGYEG